MFRMAPPGAGTEKVDIEEEMRKMKKGVITNMALFAAICVALRLSKYLAVENIWKGSGFSRLPIMWFSVVFTLMDSDIHEYDPYKSLQIILSLSLKLLFCQIYLGQHDGQREWAAMLQCGKM